MMIASQIIYADEDTRRRRHRIEKILELEHAEDVIVDAMSSGESVSEYCVNLGISEREHLEMFYTHDRYAEYYNYAKTVSDAVWDSALRRAAFGHIRVDKMMFVAAINARLGRKTLTQSQDNRPRLPPVQVVFVSSDERKDTENLDE